MRNAPCPQEGRVTATKPDDSLTPPRVSEHDRIRTCECGTIMETVGALLKSEEPYETNELCQCPKCKSVRIVS